MVAQKLLIMIGFSLFSHFMERQNCHKTRMESHGPVEDGRDPFIWNLLYLSGYQEVMSIHEKVFLPYIAVTRIPRLNGHFHI